MSHTDFRAVDRNGDLVTTVNSDCFENADYQLQADGYEVLEYVSDDTLVVRSLIPAFCRDSFTSRNLGR